MQESSGAGSHNASTADPKFAKLRATPLGPHLSSISEALRQEITAAQSAPGRAFEVRDGKCLFSREDSHIYEFRAELHVPIPVETPIRLVPETGDAIPGTIVAVRDFDVILDIRQHLGDLVERARVTSEPWFVIQALRDRLEDELAAEANDLEIPLGLLGLHKINLQHNGDAVRSTEALFQKLNQPMLVPNVSQLRSVGRCLGSRVHFVWGPPGTGKTANIAHVVRALVANGERVLVLAHANVAVDVAMLRIADSFRSSVELAEGKILRIGVPQLPEMASHSEILPEEIVARKWPDLVKQKHELESLRQDRLQRLKQELTPEKRAAFGSDLDGIRKRLAAVSEALRNTVDTLVKQARVIGATLSRMSIDDSVWRWNADAVVVDETSMASFPWVLAAGLLSRKRLLLFGDFRQLPPICLSTSSSARRWLARDAFEISGVKTQVEQRESDPPVTLLDTQYRMAEPIAALVSRFGYDGQLRSDALAVESTRKLCAMEPWPNAAAILVDTGALMTFCAREPLVGSYSRFNPLHALLASTLAMHARRDGCQTVALITPYRAQARLLAAVSMNDHPGIAAATVHRFQGSERDHVIFDLTDGVPQAGASQLTGRDADTAFRLFNVAISRARGKLVVLADVNFIRERHARSSPARTILRLLQEQGQLEAISVAQLKARTVGDSIKWYDGWPDSESALIADLRFARRSVIINIPEEFEPGARFYEALSGSARVCSEVLLFAPLKIATHLETTLVDLRLMVQPGGFFAFVDKGLVWVGSSSANGAIARVENPALVDALRKLLLASFTLPRPSADAEKTLAKIGGRCSECGEDRRPRQRARSGWVLGCGDENHERLPITDRILTDRILTDRILTDIADALQIRCPECHTLAIGRAFGKQLFLGCPNYARGCSGKLPALGNIFRGT
jgi:hypothetical protein